MKSGNLKVWIALGSYLLSLLAQANADGDQGNTEYKLKAAFVYNLVRMVDWPEERFATDDAPFVLCLLGVDQFGAAFDDILKKQVRHHPVAIRYYPQLGNEDDMSMCHLLFIQRSEAAKLSTILQRLSAYSILTVSDIEQFCEQGGMVTLATGADHRVRLEINRNAAQQASLYISARLLALARLVETLKP